VPHVFEFARDPKDEAYIDLAAAVAADYLVTFDRDLLDLMTGYDDVSKEFRQRFRQLKVVRPDEFLEIVSETGLSLGP
jgi:predicted nucleic acid-binding protein